MPMGVVGSGGPDHALALTSAAGVTTAGALPPDDALPRRLGYYDPVGLPLRSARLHHRLIRAVFAGRRLRRRVSPVPDLTLSTSRSPYPGGTRRTITPDRVRLTWPSP